jgi:hypothetical protein
MPNKFWVNEWAAVRRDEVVKLPKDFIIHNDYLSLLDKEAFIRAFSQIWEIYISIYDDISKNPDIFAMPLYARNEYRYASKQTMESRWAPLRPFVLLYNLFVSGEVNNGDFIVNIPKFKEVIKTKPTMKNVAVKNMDVLFKRLQDYGFEFQGLNNGKIPKDNNCFTVTYPDNPDVLKVLYLIASKAKNTNRLHDFCRCHYKLFKDDKNTTDYGHGVDKVADYMHTKEEQEIIYTLHAKLTEKGYFAAEREWNEGLGYAYYKTKHESETKGAYHYWLVSNKTKLNLFLRVRNVTKCLDYLRSCPASVQKIFINDNLSSNKGCRRHGDGTCKHSFAYELDSTKYLSCGCCNAPFQFAPKLQDIEHYLALLELGLK